MFGNLGGAETLIVLIITLVSFALPIVMTIVAVQWARRVLALLEQIAANTSR